jgi:uncharacterized membrane protein YdjX (TVP38/TMEM64 family)
MKIRQLINTAATIAPVATLGSLALYLLNGTAYGPAVMVLGMVATALTGFLLGETRRQDAEIESYRQRERARFEEDRKAHDALLAEIERRTSEIVDTSNAIVNGAAK